MESYLKDLQNKLSVWITNIVVLLPNLMLAILIFSLFFFIARLIRRFLNKILNKTSGHAGIVSLLSNLSYLVILLIGFFIALDLLHLEKTIASMLAGAGIIGLALGFAFQDLTANFISGVFIILRKPFEVGNMIETNGFVGIVEEVQLRSTTLRTTQGLHIMLPNRMIFQNPLTNYSLSGRRRIDLDLSLPAKINPEDVKIKLSDALKKGGGADIEKEVQIYLTDYNGDTLKLEIWFWVDHMQLDSFAVKKDEIIRKAHEVMDTFNK